MKMLEKAFFARNCLEVAEALVGKLLCCTVDGKTRYLRITETEAYNGVLDTACHASKGKTKRTEILWREAGTAYVYLCYGIHWLLNAVTGDAGDPQCVLIRGCEGFEGPGRLTKALGIDGRFNGTSLAEPGGLRLADDGTRPQIRTAKRVGIDYAAQDDKDRLWRFIAECSKGQD